MEYWLNGSRLIVSSVLCRLEILCCQIVIPYDTLWLCLVVTLQSLGLYVYQMNLRK